MTTTDMVDSKTYPFTGSVGGDSITLTFPEGFGLITTLNGDVTARGIVINLPQSGGTITSVTFVPSDVTRYNAAILGLVGQETVSPTRAVLSPATVPPVVDECSAPLLVGADGNFGPPTCLNGDVNVLAWHQMAMLGPPGMMRLGRNATLADVLATYCADWSITGTGPIDDTSYELSAAYYGWQFGVDAPDKNPAHCQ